MIVPHAYPRFGCRRGWRSWLSGRRGQQSPSFDDYLIGEQQCRDRDQPAWFRPRSSRQVSATSWRHTSPNCTTRATQSRHLATAQWPSPRRYGQQLTVARINASVERPAPALRHPPLGGSSMKKTAGAIQMSPMRIVDKDGDTEFGPSRLRCHVPWETSGEDRRDPELCGHGEGGVQRSGQRIRLGQRQVACMS